MFRRRAGARYLKTLNPYDRILSHIMTRRSDAQVYFTDEVDCKYLDEYIEKKKQEGIEISYLDIIAAAIVRLYGQRPAINRFIMNSRVFSHNEIQISMAMKKALRDDDTSTTIKLAFEGDESIFQVKEKFDGELKVNKDKEHSNSTDKLMNTIMSGPHIIVKLMVWAIKLADRWNILPKSVTDASPFHGSAFITYLKSIGIRAIYHHIYDFGTIGLFVAVGKEIKRPVIDKESGQVRPGKVLELMVVADERICDGLYYARSMRLLRRYIENPSVLDSPPKQVQKDID